MYEFLKQLCSERNTNISNLCKEATGNSGNLATWQKGYMRSDYLSKCADILGVSTDFILQRDTSVSEIKQRLNIEVQKMNDEQIEELIKYAKFLQID